MIKALYTAATGMEAQQTRIAVISNNIANMNTTAFKSSRAEFQDLLYQNEAVPGAEVASGLNTPTGLQIGSGTNVVATQIQLQPGSVSQTTNPLDLAINGDGFFQVALPNGTLAYTRAGSFTVNSNNQVVTQNGYVVQPATTIPTGASNVAVGVDGSMTATIPGTTGSQAIGNLSVYTFPDAAGLLAVGQNLYQETTASGTGVQNTPGQNGSGTIQQGYLEGSNVNVANELISMILAQRAYELNSKVVQTSDQMLSTTTQLRS